MNKYCIVAGAEFINNKAGGTKVLESNIETILKIQEKLFVYFFDYKSKQIIKKKYCNNKIETDDISYIKYPTLGKYEQIFVKSILLFFLAFKYKYLLIEHFYSLPYFKITPKYIRNKIIYSHHDFLFKIKAIKDQENKDKLKAVELNAIKKCRAVITGNYKEAVMITGMNIPTLYLPINTSKKELSATFDYSSSIYHLGSFNTTATKLGFLHFHNEILPFIKPQIDVLLIGEDSNLYAKQKMVTGLGFVDDLSQYLKRGTINIIPWKYGTGQRTRVFESLSKGNVIVSYRVLGEIIPELESGVNCVLAEDEIQFAKAINSLVDDINYREKIAEGSIRLSMQFTIENRVSKLNHFIENLK